MCEKRSDADGLLGGERGFFGHVLVLVLVHEYGCVVCCLFVFVVYLYSIDDK